MPPIRVLFVDDESAIRETLPPILRLHGYETSTVATVAEALAAITTQQFDVLIADLNIGEPGDGFTVVSAMRRTQPKCVSLILTGYPALETALQAIRSQVDDYLIKPATVVELVTTIENKLKTRGRERCAPSQRVAGILHHHLSEIVDRTLAQMRARTALGDLPLADAERADGLPVLIDGLAAQLESPDANHVPVSVLHAAAARGVTRRQQGYTVEMLVENIRLFERVVFDVVHENLFTINLSFLMLDLKRLNDSLGLQLQHTILAYLEAEERAA